MASENNHDLANQRPTRLSRSTRMLRYGSLLLFAVLLFLAAGIGWLAGTESGANAAWNFFSKRVPGAPQVQGLQGRLTGPLQLQRVTADSTDRTLIFHDVEIDWQPSALLHGQVHVSRLRIGHIEVKNKLRKTSEPARLPATLALPVQVKVDRLQVDSGAIAWGPVTVVELGAFSFGLSYDGNAYHLSVDRLAVQSAAAANPFSGTLRGQLSLASNKPYALEGDFAGGGKTEIADRTVGVSGRIGLVGSLESMQADGSFAVSQLQGNAVQALGQVHGKLQLQPFSDRPLGASNVTMQALDLALLSPGLPHTHLDARMAATANGSGELVLDNAAAGLFNDNRLPLSFLRLAFRQSGERIEFKNIQANLGSVAQPAGKISGAGHYADGALELALRTDRLDAKRLDSRMRATRMAGDIEMRHANGRQNFSLALAEPLKRNNLIVSAHAQLANEKISVDRADVRLGQSSMHAAGEIELAGTRRFRAQGRFIRFRPEEFGTFTQLPVLLLNGEFSLQGMRTPALQADLSFRIADSSLAGYGLEGEGQAQLRADRIHVPHLQLAAGDNRLTMQGELAQRSSRLAFFLHAPKLQQLGPEFGGSLEASGSAGGTPQAPHVSLQWQAANLRLPGRLQIQAAQGKAEIDIERGQPFSLRAAEFDASVAGLQGSTQQIGLLSAKGRFSPVPDAPLTLDLQVQNFHGAGWRAERIAVTGKGTTAQHALIAIVMQPAQPGRPAQRLALEASGGLRELAKQPEWRGAIERFDAEGPFAARLMQAAPLRISQQRMQLDRFRVEGDSAVIVIDQLARDARGIASRGRFERLQVSGFIKPTSPDPLFSTDLQLDGEWDISLEKSISGKAKIRRRQGDVLIRGAAPMALGLRMLEAQASAEGGRISIQALADGARLGRIDLDASTGASGTAGLALASDAPLSGRLRVDMPSIAWAGSLVSPSLITEGRIQSTVSMSGTIDKPQLAGQIAADGLRLLFTDSGIDLRQGTLQSEFIGSQLHIRSLRFPSAEGQLSVAGTIDLIAEEPSAQLMLNAQRFALLDRSDRRLTASGNSQLDVAGKRAKINGAFQIDSGFFDIGRQGAPQLSDDVVIAGRNKKQGQKMAAAVDITVGLGENVKLQGRGVNASLRGQLRLVNAAGEMPRAQGTVTIAKGTYNAYGRELAIESGVLRFTGPVNNPALDILAMRRNQEVEAGVSVRGTVLAPRVTLVSEPNVPDAEKLSWLVLGHGMTAGGEADLSMLQSAAASLLSGGAQAGVQSQLASAFGLDTVSLSTSQDTLQQRIVTLGKQVSSRLYVSYQQGLEAASSVVLFRYTLSPRITLEAEAGTRGALSIFYNFAFEGGK